MVIHVHEGSNLKRIQTVTVKNTKFLKRASYQGRHNLQLKLFEQLFSVTSSFVGYV